MDSKQIDTAMREKLPIIFGGNQYKRVLEYVSWYDQKGNRQLSAVLLSEQENYTIRVPAHLVESLEERRPQGNGEASG